jgi:Predicted transcriptional regulators
MPSDIKENLEELGFSRNETKTYIALTELGESVASKIAKKVGLPRTTTIGILKRLEEKDFISSHTYRKRLSIGLNHPRIYKNCF